jgi:hypothetical protein
MKCKKCNHNKIEHEYNGYGEHDGRCKHFELEVRETENIRIMCGCGGFKK